MVMFSELVYPFTTTGEESASFKMISSSIGILKNCKILTGEIIYIKLKSGKLKTLE